MFLNSVSTVLVGGIDDFNGMSIAWATQVERGHVIFSGPDHAPSTLRIVETLFKNIFVQNLSALCASVLNPKPSPILSQNSPATHS